MFPLRNIPGVAFETFPVLVLLDSSPISLDAIHVLCKDYFIQDLQEWF